MRRDLAPMAGSHRWRSSSITSPALPIKSIACGNVRLPRTVDRSAARRAGGPTRHPCHGSLRAGPDHEDRACGTRRASGPPDVAGPGHLRHPPGSPTHADGLARRSSSSASRPRRSTAATHPTATSRSLPAISRLSAASRSLAGLNVATDDVPAAGEQPPLPAASMHEHTAMPVPDERADDTRALLDSRLGHERGPVRHGSPAPSRRKPAALSRRGPGGSRQGPSASSLRRSGTRPVGAAPGRLLVAVLAPSRP